jgi:hypothetical protein
LLDSCFWDLFPLVVSYLLPGATNALKQGERVHQILDKMATDCNAKEMFLLLMESFENIKENSVKISLVKLLVKGDTIARGSSKGFQWYQDFQ